MPNLDSYRQAYLAVTDRLPAGASGARPIADLDLDTVAFLQYTSGTTSDPKGVIVTHGNILAQSEQLHLAWNFDQHQTFVSWLPHYHDLGLIGRVVDLLRWLAGEEIEGDEAVFVRIMERGNVDDWAQALDLVGSNRLNEFKRTKVPR